MLPLVITPGDPEGVGPEVVCRALMGRARPEGAIVVGDATVTGRWAERFGLAVQRVSPTQAIPSGGVVLVEPERTHEPVEVAALRWAVDAVRSGRAAALVTGPIHKGRLSRQGFRFSGHTGFLGHLCGVEHPVMAFVGGRVRVALVTTHLPLARVPAAITVDAVLRTLRVCEAALRDQMKLSRRHMLVCGLNPHAGDGGILGLEETQVIEPAVSLARTEGLSVEGPMSAETAFQRALAGDGDLVVAMYHDQGLVALKALDFGHTVNWTLGLPLVRTSVDHGTADDIAGRGVASSESMESAISLAETLTRR